ncbi:threonine/serine exporter family protein [Dubosiella newyorkensis]|jgi:uncharacterized membrane protein YjjB (DUF3815 family)|uniref:threonine/serine exporter family protein n=2 Tax=Dubosiella newyorkensis TaxID=1862672 RepID=UPI002355F757|nr:threonine/serine exporter family protein [Dubosiella newyorkensis]MCI9040501.1 threonine/serine exporter [Dubosiella newyorkensis]
MIILVLKALGAGIACAMCSIRFNGRGKDIVVAGFIGFMAALGMGFFEGLYTRAFVSGLIYSILSEIFARIEKKPVAVYLPAVLVPFVPGKLTFYMMGEFVHGDRLAAMNRLSEIMSVCGLIALAILLTQTTLRFLSKMIHRPEEDPFL